MKPRHLWTLEDEVLEELALCNADPKRSTARYVELSERLAAQRAPSVPVSRDAFDLPWCEAHDPSYGHPTGARGTEE